MVSYVKRLLGQVHGLLKLRDILRVINMLCRVCVISPLHLLPLISLKRRVIQINQVHRLQSLIFHLLGLFHQPALYALSILYDAPQLLDLILE